jgi:hypothetical protein
LQDAFIRLNNFMNPARVLFSFREDEHVEGTGEKTPAGAHERAESARRKVEGRR